MSALAPLVIFVYNRKDLTIQMLNKMNQNLLADETEMFIFSDGPRKDTDVEKVKDVRAFLWEFKKSNNFKSVEIIESEKNKGLANSIISGVTDIINKYGKVIVVEDDLLTSQYFLKFMNDCLDFYEKNEKIWSIGGTSLALPSLNEYPDDVYTCYRASSWGWATWKDRWSKVDWNVSDYKVFMKDRKRKRQFKLGGQDMVESLKRQMEGKTDSWAIRWCYQQSKERNFTILPKKSLVKNIGWGDEGTHCDVDRFHTSVDNEEFEYVLRDVEIDNKLMKEFRRYFSRPFINRVLDFIYLKIKSV